MSSVDWYKNDLLLLIEGMLQEMANELALEIMGQTVLNIRANNQIDTGFMMNSVYVLSKSINTYNKTQASGEYSGKQGKGKREKSPAIQLPHNALAAVAVGAVYAIFQENRQSFLYQAARDVAASAEATLLEVGRSYLQ